MISVELSGVTTMPLGNARSPATWRAVPSGATRTIMPAPGVLPTILKGVHVSLAVHHDVVPAAVPDATEIAYAAVEPSASTHRSSLPVTSRRPSGSQSIVHPRPWAGVTALISGGPAPKTKTGF